MKHKLLIRWALIISLLLLFIFLSLICLTKPESAADLKYIEKAPAQPYNPALHYFNQALSNSTVITLTDSGFTPEILTITTDSSVPATWLSMPITRIT